MTAGIQRNELGAHCPGGGFGGADRNRILPSVDDQRRNRDLREVVEEVEFAETDRKSVV